LSADLQKVVTTLIPDEVLPAGDELQISKSATEKKILLRFNASSIPSGATVTEARLSLVASARTEAQQDIRVSVLPYEAEYDAAQGKTPPDFITISSQETPKDGRKTSNPAKETFLTAINAVDGKGKKFSLLLTTPKNISSWYSATPSVDSQNQPRLILEYTVTSQPAVTQSDGLPAVQSTRPFLPTLDGGKPSGPFSYVTIPFSAAWSYTPVFYKNLVYLMTDNNGRKILNALNPLGGNPVRSMEISGDPGQHLLVSQSGLLYIVGNGKIITYQLGSGKPPQLQKFENLNPKNPPSLGPDGSLYFVNLNEVYGLNPDLKKLWKVTADETTSPVTVGPSGRFVYLTAKNKGLIAINAQTGAQEGLILPVVVTIFQDRSFTFEMRTPPVSYFIKKAAKLESGSKAPGRDKAGSITKAQVKEIAEKKMADLNSDTVEAAMRMIEGSARSMGIEVVA
jgi:large subunit ribosomal protein L11